MGVSVTPIAGARDRSTISAMQETSTSLAILASGGLDSAILLGEALREGKTVYPLYVRTHLHWEETELLYLRQFLEAVRCPALQPLCMLDLPVRDLYDEHWSVTGNDVPDADTPDEAVYLPGRNVLLLAKTMLWCHLHGVNALALGHLESNPFPDATPEFFKAFQNAFNMAVGGEVTVHRPYASLSKRAVLQRGRGLPLSFTFSCIRPASGKHCGQCNKCAERHRAFVDAGVKDPTVYAEEPSCTA